MKRFLLFSGYVYYPGGGWQDFSGSFDTKEDADAAGLAAKESYYWWHVVDSQTGQIVIDRG